MVTRGTCLSRPLSTNTKLILVVSVLCVALVVLFLPSLSALWQAPYSRTISVEGMKVRVPALWKIQPSGEYLLSIIRPRATILGHLDNTIEVGRFPPNPRTDISEQRAMWLHAVGLRDSTSTDYLPGRKRLEITGWICVETSLYLGDNQVGVACLSDDSHYVAYLYGHERNIMLLRSILQRVPPGRR